MISVIMLTYNRELLVGRAIESILTQSKLFHRELAKKLRFPELGKYDDIALMYRLLALAGKVAYHGLPKYTFYRHDGNISAWTTNHNLLTRETLEEYLDAYRTRTKLLCELFPDSAPAFCYFEWSFMISMVEKINRLEISGYEKLLKLMIKELREKRKEFMEGNYILEFEKDWMKRYV